MAQAGPTFTTAYDPMGRPDGMTDQTAQTSVQNVSYNAASQMLGIEYQSSPGLFWTESRVYNARLQLGNLGTSNAFPFGERSGSVPHDLKKGWDSMANKEGSGVCRHHGNALDVPGLPQFVNDVDSTGAVDVKAQEFNAALDAQCSLR